MRGSWPISRWITAMLRKWLKAGFIDKPVLSPTATGVPQRYVLHVWPGFPHTSIHPSRYLACLLEWTCCSSHSRGCFLMHPTPWTADQKPAQAWQAQVQPGCRPRPLHLLPQRVQAHPHHQPTAHRRGRHRGLGGEQGAESATARSCNTQATNSARTVASTLTACLLRIWLRRSSCFIFLNTSSTCHLARYIYSTSAVDQVPSVQRGDEQQPARHDKGGRRDGPPRLFGLCVASAGGRAASPRDRASRPPVVSHSAALPSGTSRATPAPDHLVAGASAAH